jgi:hypothetical protein
MYCWNEYSIQATILKSTDECKYYPLCYTYNGQYTAIFLYYYPCPVAPSVIFGVAHLWVILIEKFVVLCFCSIVKGCVCMRPEIVNVAERKPNIANTDKETIKRIFVLYTTKTPDVLLFIYFCIFEQTIIVN